MTFINIPADLSDEDIARCEQLGDFCNEEFWALLAEVKRHRSALAADMERVRSVVRETFIAEFDQFSGFCPTDQRADRVATRAAEQLATAEVGLSEEERDNAEYFVLRMRDEWPNLCQMLDRILRASDRLLGASK